MNEWLLSPIASIKGIGPQKAKRFAALGLRNLQELIQHWPTRYEDRSCVVKIRSVLSEERQLLEALVVNIQSNRMAKGQSLVKVTVDDGSGRATLLFKNAPYVASQFQQGQSYWIYGAVKVDGLQVSLFHPECKRVADFPMGFGIVPIYPLTEGISQGDIAKAMLQVKQHMSTLSETLPESVLGQIMGLAQAVSELHFPSHPKRLKAARYRVIYEEFFHLQMALLVVRYKLDLAPKVVPYKPLTLAEVKGLFPFELTGAQQRVIAQIFEDMDKPHCMNRLLQGDVGTGKTAVAMAATYKCGIGGHQTAILAPTEILAKQHARSFSGPLGKVVLLTSSLKGKARKEALESIASGDAKVVIGTHALIQEGVVFNSLKLVITDEQHRFGVGQRQLASEKGSEPLDVLVMSATPIPRTLSLVIYGDVDMSVLDEAPAGRLPIETEWLKTKAVPKLIKAMLLRLASGEQAYWIAPLIETQEALDLKSLEALFEEIEPVFKPYGIAMLHGQMNAQDKTETMNRFSRGEIKVLVATTVVEVGVDVPKATMIAIQHAERFGLSQLHQLRGRVGRSNLKSNCYLISDTKGDIAKSRLEVMTQTNDGFEIANKDLELRGPGEMIGLRQHGVPEFKMGDLIKHSAILAQAQSDAKTYAAFLGKNLTTSAYTHWLSKHLTL